MKFYGHADEVGQRIVKTFRNPELLPRALAPIFIHRKDDVPCRKWSWHNQLIAALCATTDARGFRQWEEAKRKVKKGAKAIWILGPCVKKIREKDGVTGQEADRRVLYGFKGIPVFAYEDTEGEPLPESDDRYDAWMSSLPLLEVAKAWNITVGTYSGGGATPLGYFRASSGSQAVMLGVENLSTWAHEMVHAADHRIPGASANRAHKEIVAELGGAVLLECLGLSHDADLGGAYDYIQRYAETTGKDVVRACIEVLDRVCNCVKLILDTAESLAETAEPVELAAAS